MGCTREQLAGVIWHHSDVRDVLRSLDTGPDGLSRHEAERRYSHWGPNQLRAQKRRNPLLRFLSHFHNILIYILLVAAMVTALLEHWLDTGVIVGVVLVNTLIGFFQEGKAERALEAIARMVSLECIVLRDQEPFRLPAESLVPGDVVLLQAGDKVPADLRLLNVKGLAIDEAALTGESVPVRKTIESVQPDASLGDRDGMAFSSTLVTAGSGRGVVVATAHDTQIGLISELVEQTVEVMTPLMRQIAAFGRMLALVIVGIAVVTFAFGVGIRQEAFVDMFLAAVALAVAAIPEGLPAIMTITLALGVQRMAGRNAIIRRLPAVDTLGAVTTICSDKTGTLTRNEMMVKLLRTGTNRYVIDGKGYEPEGGIRWTKDSHSFAPQQHPALVECARAGLLCNDANVTKEEDEPLWQCVGDPMEAALVVFARKAGLNDKEERRKWARVDEIPFDARHRYMATLHRADDGKSVIYLKGAPEVLIGLSQTELHGEASRPLSQSDWDGHYQALAEAGTRVLALAKVEVDESVDQLTVNCFQGKAVLLGIIGIYDPPREEAITAIQACREAGICVKMLTGDHALTAKAIGAQMGIGDGQHALTGHEIETLDDETLATRVTEIDIFARVSPEHKLRLVKALQSQGEVVAMTGDGVNDAPALKSANVGVAMGIKGTEVSKESSAMIIADDNFASIVHAVEEGRTVYANLRKAILFLLPTNGGQALTIIAAILVGMTLPITPVQILWVNMITAVTLAVALAFEPSEKGIMKMPPRHRNQPLLTPFFIWRIVFVSVTRCVGTFGLFIWAQKSGLSDEAARTLAVNVLVLFEIFYLLNVRSITGSGLTLETWTGNRVAIWAIATVIVGQLLFTYLPWFQQLFGTVSLTGDHWIRITLITLAAFFLVEIEKWWIRWRYGSAQQM